MTQGNAYPKRFNFEVLQKKWMNYWEKQNIYKFDLKKKGEIFTIDTPPPFVSGTLHMGHILNHSWIDFVARYQRMKGVYNVYFPQGFDCHGLPVELAVQKNYHVKKDDRETFLAKCIEWVEKNIHNMTAQLNNLAYSTDWNYTYRTMNDSYKRKVQISLLDFYEKGLLYREKFPTHFCVNCETSVAKAEVGYEDELGKLYYIKLPLVNRENEYLTIATTRPEYMEACVAVLINPRDDRYTDLSAAEVRIPLTERSVRVYLNTTVDMNFGTGVVYVCTYGDEMDIKWKLEYSLDEIQIFTTDGHMNQNSRYQGLTILEAREKIIEDLRQLGLIEKVEDYQHSIIVHSERASCNKPIEYLPVYQWFINVRDYTTEIINSAETMKWFPEKHKQRLIDWAKGLDWNWVISRQRVFGTPIPFWYCEDCGEIIPAKRETLPIDPVKTTSPIKKCPNCKGSRIVGEKDVCDCWIDSSITPLVIAKWLDDESFFTKAYIKAKIHRPQGYEIIRTWLFYTIFRCKILTGKSPFSEAMINGMVAGPDGRHMSKSYGNMISPDEIVPNFGVDAIRAWAAMGSLGDDYPFEFTWINSQNKQPVSDALIQKEMKSLTTEKFKKKYQKRYEQLTGASRFLTKIWNAYRFLYINSADLALKDLTINPENLSAVEAYFFNEFNDYLTKVTHYFEEYNWHEAFMILRTFFWNDLCDDYLESVKYRFYSDNEDLKKLSLKNLLNLFYKMLLMLSIIMPYITEEIYSIIFSNIQSLPSIHLEQWPTPYEGISKEVAAEGKMIINVIKNLRNIKSKLQIPLNEEITEVIIVTNENNNQIITKLAEDITKTIRIKKLTVKNKPFNTKLRAKSDFIDRNEDLDLEIHFLK